MTSFPPPQKGNLQEEGDVLSPKFDADGLITAVACDNATGEVLMLAHMNAEALQKTLQTGKAHYWSRSRQSIWLKGETSGNVQEVVEMRIDCDQDAIVMKVTVDGADASCHTGRVSCFFRIVKPGKDGAYRLEMEARDRVFDPDKVY